MKPLLTAIVLFYFLSPAFSQRFRFDLDGQLAFYNLKAPKGSSVQYSTKPGLKSGLGMTCYFSDKVSATSGLGYNIISHNVSYRFTALQPNDPAIPVSSEFKPGYLEIPILVNYHFIRQPKTNLYLSTGLISSHLVSENDKTSFQDNSVHKSGYLNSQLFSFQLAAGALFSVNQKLGIKVEPQYRKFFKGFDRFMSESFGAQNPSAINVNVGIAFYPGKRPRS